ncbi:MAG TPA: hypothetical protein VHE61_22580 [Opitutaceae bacterium]|nr:hypothetical protein [Opitutaceae bacterium]
MKTMPPVGEPAAAMPSPAGGNGPRPGRGGFAGDRVRGPGLRAICRNWLGCLVLLVLPVVVYWPAIFARYGFRDDYSVLRESHEEAGKVVRVCAMQARPLDGLMMAGSFRMVPGIDGLRWLRLGTSLLLGCASVAWFAVGRRLGWNPAVAALSGVLIVLLPAAQIIASWAVGWPLIPALLLALAAFVLVERAMEGRSGAEKLGWWTAAILALAASALIYPTNTLFYFSALAAGLWSRRRWAARRGFAWLAGHTLTLGVGLALAFSIAMTTFARGWVPASSRVALEHDWWGKLQWFAREPLRNALALIALNENGGSATVHRLAGFVALVIGAGLCRRAFVRGWRASWWWLASLAFVLVSSFGVNLAVANRWSAYRVLLPLSATVVVLLAMALLSLGGRALARSALLALAVFAVVLARRQTLQLIARPQAIELRSIEAGARRIDPARSPRVFVRTPTAAQHIAPRVFGDEFGSLSTDSDWAPKEMLKLVMRERYPMDPDVTRRYTCRVGRALPGDAPVDVFIDLPSTFDSVRPAVPAAVKGR